MRTTTPPSKAGLSEYFGSIFFPVTRASVATLVPGAPGANDACETTFGDAEPPWPPAGTPVPTAPCGTQRVGLNAAPAVGPDGTVYIVTRAHTSSRYAYLVAVHPDLTPAWATSLRSMARNTFAVPM